MANTKTAPVVSIVERRHASLGPKARGLEHPSVMLPAVELRAVTPAFGNALAISLALHGMVAFYVTFMLPAQPFFKAPETTLEVVLVNSKSARQPVRPDVLAQANLDGGGNTDEARQAKTPLPVTPSQNDHLDDANLTRKVQTLEQEAQQLMTKLKSDKKLDKQLPQGEMLEKPEDALPTDLVEKSLQMAQLEARVTRNMEIYQQRPKRQFVGARAKEFRFATYVDQWRQKIERVGSLNYPEEAKIRKLYGHLQLTVAIKSDGNIERVDITRSSGYKILDDAAKRIIFLASPFSAFPDEIRKDTDILEITRTWTFTREDQISSE